MKKAEERVVSNIVKIRTIRNITKRAMADSIGVGEVTYARIENGTIALSYDYLSRIASSFNMREIDIITYPEVYIKQTESNAPSRKISVTFEVDESEKEYLLRLVQQKR